ncbi:MAG: Ig domain-containing protein [Acidobacteriia bacterium]|nr:Ig domain-containing protein [Terriglobia bacterium]
MIRIHLAGRLLPALLLVAALCGCGGGGTSAPFQPPPAPPPPAPTLTITTDSNIKAVINVPFSITLQAANAVGTLTWSVTAGSLASGLTLDSATGTISGTPASGSSPVTIQVADSKSTASKQFNFTFFTQLLIYPVTPFPAHLNAPYSLQLLAQYSGFSITGWTVSAGQLPPGLQLTLSASNTTVAYISGTPTQTGTFSFTVQVQDSSLPQTATLALTIVVDANLTITKSTLMDGGQNQPYSDFFSAVNGTLPYQWSATGLPAGLTLNPSTGQVSGTPTVYYQFPYTVTVQDSGSPRQSDSKQGTMNLAQQLAIIGTLPNVYLNQYYSASLFTIGGRYPAVWTIASGQLPPGISMNSSGYFYGKASLLGSYSFVVQVQDSSSPPYVVTQSMVLNVVPPPLIIGGVPLSPAPLGILYHSQIPLSGGTPPYAWSISSGQLPPGIVLDPATGYLDGVPTQLGTFMFVAHGTDSASPPQAVSVNEYIEIRTPLGRNDSIATATPVGNSATVSVQASISPYIDPIAASTPNPDMDYYKLVANAGSAVHLETFAQRSWGANLLDSVIEILDAGGNRLNFCTSPNYTSPCLNDDLSSSTLDSALDFKVPGAAGTQATFYLRVFDWRGDARPDMQYFLNISGVIDPLVIKPSSLGPGATRGVSYQQQFSSTGGTGTVTWALDSGTLPPGWSLSSAGLLSGTATTNGTYTFTVMATDTGNPPQVARMQYTMQITDPVTITSPAVWPNACVNQPYSFQVTVSGGLPPYGFSFSSSAWIPINLNQSTGVFSGTSGGTGTFTGRVGVIDSSQPLSSAWQDVTLNVVTCP